MTSNNKQELLEYINEEVSTPESMESEDNEKQHYRSRPIFDDEAPDVSALADDLFKSLSLDYGREETEEDRTPIIVYKEVESNPEDTEMGNTDDGETLECNTSNISNTIEEYYKRAKSTKGMAIRQSSKFTNPKNYFTEVIAPISNLQDAGIKNTDVNVPKEAYKEQEAEDKVRKVLVTKQGWHLRGFKTYKDFLLFISDLAFTSAYRVCFPDCYLSVHNFIIKCLKDHILFEEEKKEAFRREDSPGLYDVEERPSIERHIFINSLIGYNNISQVFWLIERSPEDNELFTSEFRNIHDQIAICVADRIEYLRNNYKYDGRKASGKRAHCLTEDEEDDEELEEKNECPEQKKRKTTVWLADTDQATDEEFTKFVQSKIRGNKLSI